MLIECLLIKRKNAIAEKIGIVNDGHELESPDKKILMDKFTSIYKNPCSTSRPDTNEIIRLVNALYCYRSSPTAFKAILNDHAYGFATSRSPLWMRNRSSFLNQYASGRSAYHSFILRIRNWCPIDFTREMREKYIRETTGFSLPTDVRPIHDKLVEIDTESCMKSSFHHDINAANGFDILKAVIPAAKFNELNIWKLMEWDKEIAPAFSNRRHSSVNSVSLENPLQIIPVNSVSPNTVVEEVLSNHGVEVDPFDFPDIPSSQVVHVSANQESDPVPINHHSIVTWLFKKYSFNQFNQSEARRYCRSSSRRISNHEWVLYLNKLSPSFLKSIQKELLFTDSIFQPIIIVTSLRFNS